MIQNRLEKNLKKLQAWAEKNQIEAYRIYDRDIPEYPFIVDRYKNYFVVYDKSQKIDEEKNHLPLLVNSIKNIFKCSESEIIIKRRQKQKGTDQYQKLDEKNEKIIIKENGVLLYVNLWDYLDTGLFLDHRPIRYQFLKQTRGHRFLNLFCYTASASVMAAKCGATTYSIDMSKNYLDWAQENFKLNELSTKENFFIEEDVLQFIEPLLCKGAIVYFDDFYMYEGNPEKGEQKAFLEYQAVSQHGFNPHLNVSWFGKSFLTY